MNSAKFLSLVGYLCMFYFISVQGTTRISDKFMKVMSCSPSENIPCTAYFLKGFQNCSPPVLYQIFPDLYNLTDDGFPERPKIFEVKPIESLYSGNNKMYPGANVTMQLPKTSSYKDVKAFEFTYYEVMDNVNVRCCIMDLSNNSFSSEDRDLKFVVKVWPLLAGEYYFEGYSLPKPPPNEDSDMYRSSFLKIQRSSYGVAEDQESADWSTLISYSVKSEQRTGEKSIAMEFAPPPEKFHFTVFEVQLWLGENEDKLLKTKNLTNTYKDEFTGLQSGIYTIKVTPYDLLFNTANCLCKKNTVCHTCMQTSTGKINVTYIPLPVTSTTTSITSTPASSPPLYPLTSTAKLVNPTNSEDGKIAAAIVGAVIGVVLVVVMVLCWLRYRHTKRKHAENKELVTDQNQNIQNVNKPTEGGLDNPRFHSLSEANLPVVTENSPYVNILQSQAVEQPRENTFRLDRKKVFLAFAEDHVSHVNVVKCFANFLHIHCQCDVIFAPYCTKEIMEDKFRWILNSMDRSQFIIIVNSISAYHQYEAWKSRSSTSSSSLSNGSPLADIFVSMIQQVANRLGKKNPDYTKYIMVRFDYTKEDYLIDDICSGGEYLLMKHLQELLCHIHTINQHTTPMKDVGLAFVEDYSQLVEGQQLAENIKVAMNYERENPDWYKVDHYDSGLDSAENLPEEDRDVIRRNYEEMESISNIINHDNHSTSNRCNIPVDLHSPEPPYCEIDNPDNQSGPGFYPPSINIESDIQSEMLQQELSQLNERNMGEQNFTFQSGISPPYATYDEESECISLGGKSV